MDHKNCKLCGTVFRSDIRNICRACLEDEEKNETVEQIKEFLRRFPRANIFDISRGLRIDASEVLLVVKSGVVSYEEESFNRLIPARQEEKDHTMSKHKPASAGGRHGGCRSR